MDELSELRAQIGLFTSGTPDYQRLKEKVKNSEPREIISHKGNVYAIRYNELRNRGLDYGDQIELMCFNKGLYNPVFFGKACSYCSNATQNLPEEIAVKKNAMVIINNTSQIDWGCTYNGKENIEVATVFGHRKKKNLKFYAIRTERCAFEDSLISYLAENSLIEDCKVDLPFGFIPITNFDPSQPIPREFLFKEVNKKLPKERKRFWIF